MQLFHVRFDTESGDHWSSFVKANSKAELYDILESTDQEVRANMEDGDEAYNNCSYSIEQVKVEKLETFKQSILNVFEQEICC